MKKILILALLLMVVLAKSKKAKVEK